MQPAKRRRSDASSRASPDAASSRDGAHAQVDPWITECAAHLLLLEPAMSRAEAQAIAESMRNFERTGAMAPPVAAEFVASEMRKPDGERFERRGGPATVSG